MNLLALNLLLALAWMMLTGSFTATSLLSGLVFSYMALWIAFNRKADHSSFFWKVPKVISFIGFFIYDLVKANLVVAWDVLTPTHLMKPGVIAFPLRAHTDAQITVLANLISVTPGTLSLDVSTDRKVLYIHAMYLQDEDKLRRELQDLESRVMELID